MKRESTKKTSKKRTINVVIGVLFSITAIMAIVGATCHYRGWDDIAYTVWGYATWPFLMSIGVSIGAELSKEEGE